MNANDLRSALPAMFDSSMLEVMTFRSRAAGNAQNTFAQWTVQQVRRRLQNRTVTTADGTRLFNSDMWFDVYQLYLDNARAIPPTTGVPPPPKIKDEFVDAAGVTYIVQKVTDKALLANRACRVTIGRANP
jgi:hypothetical protein